MDLPTFAGSCPGPWAMGKKMGLTVTSTKGEDGERTYSVEA
ncbi:MAG: hypothetical protein ABSB35_13020 [Bryobacteraceae bacterium]